MDMMHLSDGAVSVALSKRNLQTLLKKLEFNERVDMGIEPGDPPRSEVRIERRVAEQGLLIVTGEPDDIHYDRPEGPPGPMLDNATGGLY